MKQSDVVYATVFGVSAWLAQAILVRLVEDVWLRWFIYATTTVLALAPTVWIFSRAGVPRWVFPALEIVPEGEPLRWQRRGGLLRKGAGALALLVLGGLLTAAAQNFLDWLFELSDK